MKILLPLLFIFLTYSPEVSLQASPGEITTFILVRHAEKVDDSHDPDLSAEGYERAGLLAKMLHEIDFDAVYSTPLIRTTETARPIAAKHDFDILEYDHRDPETHAAEWKEKYRGKTVLIAGHSNSTPTFANALLGREHFNEKFDESDYGNILIVTISKNGRSYLLHLRY